MGRRELVTVAIVLGALIVSFRAVTSGSRFVSDLRSAPEASPAEPSAAAPGSTVRPPEDLQTPAPVPSSPSPSFAPAGCPSHSGYGY